MENGNAKNAMQCNAMENGLTPNAPEIPTPSEWDRENPTGGKLCLWKRLPPVAALDGLMRGLTLDRDLYCSILFD